jgi:hypothetical protein
MDCASYCCQQREGCLASAASADWLVVDCVRCVSQEGCLASVAEVQTVAQVEWIVSLCKQRRLFRQLPMQTV